METRELGRETVMSIENVECIKDMLNTLQHWCLRTVRQGMGGTVSELKGK